MCDQHVQAFHPCRHAADARIAGQPLDCIATCEIVAMCRVVRNSKRIIVLQSRRHLSHEAGSFECPDRTGRPRTRQVEEGRKRRPVGQSRCRFDDVRQTALASMSDTSHGTRRPAKLPFDDREISAELSRSGCNTRTCGARACGIGPAATRGRRDAEAAKSGPVPTLARATPTASARHGRHPAPTTTIGRTTAATRAPARQQPTPTPPVSATASRTALVPGRRSAVGRAPAARHTSDLPTASGLSATKRPAAADWRYWCSETKSATADSAAHATARRVRERVRQPQQRAPRRVR